MRNREGSRIECSYPNQIRGADGVLRCLTCGQTVEKIKQDVEPEKKPVPKRTTRKTKAD